ncbi:MAG: hypothetical protein HQK76_21205 [Desulfobacterales bacterium]|nr:hypothetical protein [Desulfobacterales bacterium]
MKDPIIEEIRRIRDEHSKQFNYDLDAICEDFKQHQVKLKKSRLIRLKPKVIEANKRFNADVKSFAPGGRKSFHTG